MVAIGFLGGLAAKVGGSLVRRAGRAISSRFGRSSARRSISRATRRTPSRSISSRAARRGRTVGRGVTAAAVGVPLVRSVASSQLPALPPAPPPSGGRVVQRGLRRDLAPRTRGGVTRPLTDQTDKVGRPLVVEGTLVERMSCPTGYVAVTMPNGNRVCMLKGTARSAGLWKARKKPPISVRDWERAKAAEKVQDTFKKKADVVGLKLAKRKS